MPQGSLKVKKTLVEGKKGRINKTKKGKLFKAPKKMKAKESLLIEKSMDRVLMKKTEEKAKSMLAKEGSKLKILDTPPILSSKQKQQKTKHL